MSNDEFYMLPENVYEVLDQMKKSNHILIDCDTNYLCQLYKQLFPIEKDGVYPFSLKHLEALLRAVTDKALLKLVDMGYMEMVWDDETDNFGFKLTNQGREYAEHLKDKEE